MFQLPTPQVLRWDDHLCELHSIRHKSDDPDTQMSAILISASGEVIYDVNRLPDGVEKYPERLIRPEKYDWIEHAERNTILHAAASGVKTAEATMYTLCMPCIDCARAIAGAKISMLYIDYAFTAQYLQGDASKWEAGFHKAMTLMQEGGVSVIFAKNE